MTRKKKQRRAKPAGRPEAYRKEYAVQARKLCLLGYIDRELAEFFNISEKTLNAWKERHPIFLQSIKEGKALPDADVAACLLHRAMGYSHKAVKIMQADGESYEHEYVEHYPPDTAAGIFWLKNRQPEKWRDTARLEHTGKDGEEMTIKTIIERAREIQKLNAAPVEAPNAEVSDQRGAGSLR